MRKNVNFYQKCAFLQLVLVIVLLFEIFRIDIFVIFTVNDIADLGFLLFFDLTKSDKILTWKTKNVSILYDFGMILWKFVKNLKMKDWSF